MGKLHSWGRKTAAWYVESSPWLAGAFGLACVALVSGMAVVDIEKLLSSSVTIGWATALATLAAAIVALRVAGTSSREARESERLAGKLATARIPPLLHIVRTELESAGATVNNEGMYDNESALNSTVKNYGNARTALLQIDIPTLYRYDRRLTAGVVELIDVLGVLTLEISRKRAPNRILRDTAKDENAHLLKVCAAVEMIALEARGDAIESHLDELQRFSEMSIESPQSN